MVSLFCLSFGFGAGVERELLLIGDEADALLNYLITAVTPLHHVIDRGPGRH